MLKSASNIYIRTPEGTSLDGTNAVLQQIEAELWKLRGIRHVLAAINSSGQGTVTEADIYVRLAPLNQRDFSQFDIMSYIRNLLQQNAGLRSAVTFIAPFCSGGRGQGQLEFNIRGPDMGLLADYSKKVMEEWGKFPE